MSVNGYDGNNLIEYASRTLVDAVPTANSTRAVSSGGVYDAVKDINRRVRRDISSDLSNLPQAISEQNLEKYGYTIGDYFRGSSGYWYILADKNTFKGTDAKCISSNHLGIVVNTVTQSQWHSENAANVGYAGSVLHSYLSGTVLDNIKSDIAGLFGSWENHLIAHSKMLTTGTETCAWVPDQYISALTATQCDAGSQCTMNGYQEGEASKSLELFRKYKWTEIFGGVYAWLRNLSNNNTTDTSSTYATIISNTGFLSGTNRCTNAYGYAVGIINFK